MDLKQRNKKGKPVTTSVPSISIKFNASVGEIEEFNISDDEDTSKDISIGSEKIETASANTDSEGSPLRSYLPRIGKRSTSVDVSPSSNISIQDASPPTSDPWRFFSDIKGKITKSVEGKLTEYKKEIKSENSEGSPKIGLVKNSKENSSSKESSSLSDSEDISESSISKTCGILSTTEGVEMSSDDETPSFSEKIIAEDEKNENESSSATKNVNVKIKTDNQVMEISVEDLNQLHELSATTTTTTNEKMLNKDDEIEDGIDVLLADCIENMHSSIDGSLDVEKIPGFTLRESFIASEERERTVFAPIGFVDMRHMQEDVHSWHRHSYMVKAIVVSVFAVLLYFWSSFPLYITGFFTGCFVTGLICVAIYVFNTKHTVDDFTTSSLKDREMFEIPSVKEYAPLSKFEGWMNEYPDVYNPHTYHISQTQSVYLKLQGNLLKVSHTRSKIPKRAMWNEPQHKPQLTHHRIYNLLGARVTILPEGLARKRRWSKKYPIGITLHPDQLLFTIDEERPQSSLSNKQNNKSKKTNNKQEDKEDKDKATTTTTTEEAAKINEEEDDLKTESSETFLMTERESLINEKLLKEDILTIIDKEIKEDQEKTKKDKETKEDEGLTKLYFFGRSDREKEDWFRRFASATHKGANEERKEESPEKEEPKLKNENHNISETLINDVKLEDEYRKYMQIFYKVKPHSIKIPQPRIPSSSFSFPQANAASKKNNEKDGNNENSKEKDKEKEKDKDKKEEKSSQVENADLPNEVSVDMFWVNSLLGRILFDCMRDPDFTQKVKDRIQRKLSVIKLPYFIDELIITELSLGSTPPIIHKASAPTIDERGLWVDLDFTYEGTVVLTLLTKINLLKLKDKPVQDNNKIVEMKNLAMFHSDVDDSAETSSDDEMPPQKVTLNSQQQDNNACFSSSSPLDAQGNPIQGLGGTSTTSKKFIRIVDKIADSRMFKAASNYKYIKKLMEDVSNTDLGLKVEVKALAGTLVLNIPPPPSDRVWISFRPTPKLLLTAFPIVGERNISFMYVTSWIEQKLIQEFHKLLVIPNMEDIMIPVMCSEVPR